MRHAIHLIRLARIGLQRSSYSNREFRRYLGPAKAFILLEQAVRGTAGRRYIFSAGYDVFYINLPTRPQGIDQRFNINFHQKIRLFQKQKSFQRLKYATLNYCTCVFPAASHKCNIATCLSEDTDHVYASARPLRRCRHNRGIKDDTLLDCDIPQQTENHSIYVDSWLLQNQIHQDTLIIVCCHYTSSVLVKHFLMCAQHS